MPVRDVLVGNAGCHVEHDDTALAVDVVTVTETTELLLAGGIPDIELDGTKVLKGAELVPVSGLTQGACRRKGALSYCGETQRVNIDTEGGNVLLLELARQMALDEGGL